MKTLITTAIVAVVLAGFGGQAEARDHCGSFHSHSHCGSFHSHGCSSLGLSFGLPLFYSRPYYSSYSYPYSGYYGGGYGYHPTYRYRSYGYDDPAVNVQVALARRGFYNGSIDGVIGPMSRSAIRRYQLDRGLPITGAIDYPLMRSLGIR